MKAFLFDNGSVSEVDKDSVRAGSYQSHVHLYDPEIDVWFSPKVLGFKHASAVKVWQLKDKKDVPKNIRAQSLLII